MLVTFYNEVSSVNETNENSYIYIFTVTIIQKKKRIQSSVFMFKEP